MYVIGFSASLSDRDFDFCGKYCVSPLVSDSYFTYIWLEV